MPKGVTAERLMVCRACAAEFLTTRIGKAAFYCHQPECDDMRASSRIRTANHPVPPAALNARQTHELDRIRMRCGPAEVIYLGQRGALVVIEGRPNAVRLAP